MISLTIQDEIDYGMDQEFSHRTFNDSCDITYTKNGETIKVPINPLISKYKEYFDNYIIEEELDDIMATRYRFSPKKLSYDYYGTTQYWSIILYINGAHSILNFEPEESVKLIEQSNLEEILNEIMILEGLI